MCHEHGNMDIGYVMISWFNLASLGVWRAFSLNLAFLGVWRTFSLNLAFLGVWRAFSLNLAFLGVWRAFSLNLAFLGTWAGFAKTNPTKIYNGLLHKRIDDAFFF